MILKKQIFHSLLLALLPIFIGNAQTYRLVWADEFNDAESAVNWNKEVTDRPSNHELQAYTDRDSNIAFADGNLVLTARREMKADKHFTSGRVNSCERVNFLHGVVQARILLPKTKGGLWPAFWMMGDDIVKHGWPRCGEIDIVEWGSVDGRHGREETYFSAAVHWGENWDKCKSYYYPTNNGYSVQDDYHIWTCEWTEDSMKCYLDDQQEPYFRVFIGNGSEMYPYVHKPSHILFNLAVGGYFTQILDPMAIMALPDDGSEARMLIDWVRVYQEKGKENAVWRKNDKKDVPRRYRKYKSR